MRDPLNLPDRIAALLDGVTVGCGVGTKVFRPDAPSLKRAATLQVAPQAKEAIKHASGSVWQPE